MDLPYRPLGLVKEVLEQIGADVSYVYEDLIFVNHNLYLLQFGETGELLLYHANTEASTEDAQQTFETLRTVATPHGLTIINQGRYSLTEGEGENITLQFLPAASNC